MKTKLIPLAVLLLLQSCFSYKQLEPDSQEILVGNRYKLKHSEYQKFRKGKILAISDSTLTYKISKNQIDELSMNGIQEIKRARFSLVKTIGIPVAVTAVTYGVLLLAVGRTGLGLGEIDLGY